MKRKSTDITLQEIRSMTQSQQIQIAQKLAKRANSRIKALRKADINYFSIESHSNYLASQKNNLFYEGKKYASKTELENALFHLYRFTNARSSTVRGAREVEKEVLEKFASYDRPIIIPAGKTKEFFQFLNSEQYKWLVRHNYDSSQVQENLAEAMKTLSYDEIQNTFDTYISQNDEDTERGLETLFAEKGVQWD